MWIYVIGAISMFAFAFATTLAADYTHLPWRIVLTMAGGPFLALAMWCFVTARWRSPSRRSFDGESLFGSTRTLLLYAAASFLLYCVVVSLVPEFSSTPTRIAVAMSSGAFFGLSLLYFVRALAKRRREDTRAAKGFT